MVARLYTEKDEALDELVRDMKTVIRYAENTTDFNDDDHKAKPSQGLLAELRTRRTHSRP